MLDIQSQKGRQTMKNSIITIVLVVVIVLASCSLFPGSNLTFDDIKGEWDFPNTATISDVHLSLMEPSKIDLGWSDSTYSYWCWTDDGIMNGATISGTYSYNKYDKSSNLVDSSSNLSFSVTFSLNDGKLKAVFSGTGPIQGLVLEYGTKTVQP